VDFSIIDDLYEIYKNEDIVYAQEMFDSYYYKHQMHGRMDLIAKLQEYIKQQTASVGNYYVSEKDDSFSEHLLIESIVLLFENVLIPVSDLLVDFVFDGVAEEEIKDYDIPLKMTKPHDLFNMDLKFIEEAVNKDETYIEDFNSIKNIIQYVKKNKLLDKIYKDNSWYDLEFSEVIYSLYDFIEDKSIFNIDLYFRPEKVDYLFEKIKANCAHKFKGVFDKFRPNMNSSKQMRTHFGKLMFCKTLLMYYENGILPDSNGFVDFSVDEIQHLELIEDFKKLYSKKFNEESFRSNQSNIICIPEVFSFNYTLVAEKKVKQGDKMIFGYLIACDDDLKYTRNDYLVHIEINDVNNPLSSYEMQLNLIPRGNINQRLQLIRLDNWQSEQTHRNIAKKLSTTTHVHLYNEFDLLRGKINGAFDIAYNVDGVGTAFDKSLNMFLDILDLGGDISKNIYNSTIKNINAAKRTSTEKEI